MTGSQVTAISSISTGISTAPDTGQRRIDGFPSVSHPCREYLIYIHGNEMICSLRTPRIPNTPLKNNENSTLLELLPLAAATPPISISKLIEPPFRNKPPNGRSVPPILCSLMSSRATKTVCASLLPTPNYNCYQQLVFFLTDNELLACCHALPFMQRPPVQLLVRCIPNHNFTTVMVERYLHSISASVFLPSLPRNS